jgi:mannose-6-phosphate isomerase-like protein (cupin superfamily)
VTGRGLEVLEWNQVGYQPLVFSHDWQVALLNWEQIFDLEKLGEVERHNQTDEVFVLLKGRALIFTVDDQGMQTEDMKPGVLYNVRQGVWHNLVSTRDASWVIVENRDTHLNDCDFRKLSPQELTQVKTNLPDWAS